MIIVMQTKSGTFFGQPLQPAGDEAVIAPALFRAGCSDYARKRHIERLFVTALHERRALMHLTRA